MSPAAYCLSFVCANFEKYTIPLFMPRLLETFSLVHHFWCNLGNQVKGNSFSETEKLCFVWGNSFSPSHKRKTFSRDSNSLKNPKIFVIKYYHCIIKKDFALYQF